MNTLYSVPVPSLSSLLSNWVILWTSSVLANCMNYVLILIWVPKIEFFWGKIGGRHKQDVSKASGSAWWLYTISVSATTSDYSLAITYW